jgi:hypothetical protein
LAISAERCNLFIERELQLWPSREIFSSALEFVGRLFQQMRGVNPALGVQQKKNLKK